MAKRGNGEGSISKRSDGRWQGQISLGRDIITGKVTRKTIYGKTRKEVSDKLKIILADHKKGFFIKDSKSLFKDKMNYWLYQKKKLSLNGNTWNTYEIACRIHLLPVFGDMEITNITKQMIQSFITAKAEVLSPATVKKIYSILQQILEDAVDEDIILRNPARKIELPKIREKEIVPLSKDEMNAILTACYGTRLYPVIFVEYGTGLRRSEILALTWDNINFENKTLSINKRYIMIKSTPTLQYDTKTAASKLPISVPDSVIKYLQNLSLSRTSEFIFPGKNGLPMDPNHFRRDFKIKVNQAIKELKKKNPNYSGLENIRFHDLRHNYASQLVALNIHQRLIQAQMRHSDSRTTNRYSHVTMAGQKEVADILDATLISIKPKFFTATITATP